MTDTYCGKNCAECAMKATLNCPGCKTGPGRPFGGDCELAGCVREKGHESCGTCRYNGTCGMLMGRMQIPETRQRRAEAEHRRQTEIAGRTPELARWLWILFWLVIPANVAGLMVAEPVAEVFPALLVPGELLSAASTAAYGLILVKLAAQEQRYRTAGICILISAAANLLVGFLPTGADTWTLLISLPAAIVGLAAAYNEYMAHGAVLEGVDQELSGKWHRLWKWEIGLLGLILGSVLLAVIAPMLAILTILGGAVGLIVISVMKLVYLYRTAKVFRDRAGMA